VWNLVTPEPCGWGDVPVTFSVRQDPSGVYPAWVSPHLQDEVRSWFLISSSFWC